MSTFDHEDPSAPGKGKKATAQQNDEAAYQAQWEQYQKLTEELMNAPGTSRRASPPKAGTGKTPG
jgi:hypothetical protein